MSCRHALPTPLLAVAIGAVAAALVAVALLAPAAHAAPAGEPTAHVARRSGVAACPAANAIPRDRTARKRTRRALLCLINRERVRHGVPRLRANRCLARAARKHTRDMVRRSYFSHVSRDGRQTGDRVRRTGYVPRGGRWLVGENLYWGSRAAAGPTAVVRGWLRSPGHRANLLSARFRDVGLAAVAGAPARASGAAATYAADFGARSGGRARCK